MLSNSELAEFTTRILESAVSNEQMTYRITDIVQAYEEIYKTIKKMDQES